MKEKRVCPMCGRKYDGEPALSRTDGHTPICHDCGQRQALHELGLSPIDPELEALIERYEKGATG